LHTVPGLLIGGLIAPAITPPAELTAVTVFATLVDNLANCVRESFTLNSVGDHLANGDDALRLLTTCLVVEVHRHAM